MDVNSDTIYELQKLNSGPLLPNIQSISWTVRGISGASGFNGLEFLLTPTLTSLELVYERDEGQKLPMAFMRVISTKCPHLQHLRLKASSDVLDAPSLLLVLRDFGALQQLALAIDDNGVRNGRSRNYTVTSSLLSRLAAFSNLSELRLSNGSIYARGKDVVGPFRFPSVKVLHLYSDAVTSSVMLWEDCEFPFIRELSIEYGTPSSDPAAPLALLSRITTDVSHDTLQSLTLRYSRKAWLSVKLASPNGMVSWSLLRSLLVFHNLRHFAFELPSKPFVPWTDVDLETFARAWPHLRTLRIANDDTVTYRGLAALVHLCPDLSELTINIAPTPILEGPEDVADLPVGHSVLLDFRHSSVGDAESVVLWLARIFLRNSSMNQREMLWESPWTRPAWREVFALCRILPYIGIAVTHV